jgi:hypothetical protein
VTRHHRPLLSPSGSRNKLEPHGVTLAGYCYGMKYGMKVQTVTLCRVSQLQRYGVTVLGNVTSVYGVTVRGNVTVRQIQSAYLFV